MLKVLVALLVLRNHALEGATGQHSQLGLLLMRNYAVLLHLDAWPLIKVLGLRVIHQERGPRMILLAHILATPLLDGCLASLSVHEIVIRKEVLFLLQGLVGGGVYHYNVARGGHWG